MPSMTSSKNKKKRDKEQLPLKHTCVSDERKRTGVEELEGKTRIFVFFVSLVRGWVGMTMCVWFFCCCCCFGGMGDGGRDEYVCVYAGGYEGKEDYRSNKFYVALSVVFPCIISSRYD